VVYPEDVLQQQDNTSHLVLHTPLGDVAIQLLPELAPASVRELKRAAKMQANSISRCSNCRIYRCGVLAGLAGSLFQGGERFMLGPGGGIG
jgi:hypothetical protein